MSSEQGWQGRFFEDFEVGALYQHPLGRTVSEADNTWFTLLTMNTNQLHFNTEYAAKSEFGRPLVVSTLTVAIAVGQSVTDLTQNAVANLGWDDIRMTHPVFAGDTLFSESIVLEKRESGSRPTAGIVKVKTRTLNQDGKEVCSFLRIFLVHKRGAPQVQNTFPVGEIPLTAPEEKVSRPAPLSGVRILAVEQYGAGPWGSLHLADLGAEVIKIEEPRSGGDVGRYVPPYAEGEDSLFFEAFNRNKRSISLDVTNPRGREVFERLVRESDAVDSNLRGDVPAKIGITYDDLKHINPAIVCCSLSGFGMTGPRAEQPGYDYLLQGLAGWMDLTGDPGGPPTKSGVSLVDFTGGYAAALALLAGLHAAQRDGIGMDCDISLYDTALTLLNYPAAWHLNAGFEPARTRHSAHPSLVPFQAFETRDGWMVVACPKEKFWVKLAARLGHSEWTTNPKFDNFAHRYESKDELLPLLEAEFVTRDTAEWIDVLTSDGVPCAPINNVAQALTEPHTIARDLIVETEHPRFGTVRQLASPVRVGSQRPAYRRAPMRNEDLAYVVEKIAGYDADNLETLATEGAFGDVAVEATNTSPQNQE